MFALVLDGEFQGLVPFKEVKKVLADGQKVEVARFSDGKGWVPVCLEWFL